MASMVTPTTGQTVVAEMWAQITEAWSGLRNTPLALTGINDATNYALTVKNAGTGSKNSIFYAADGTTVLLQVDSAGVKASPDGTAATNIVTAGGTADLTNKTYAATHTGAVAGGRFVGATASGAPVTGTFSTGDYVIDLTGKVWVNTAGGTPGTWINVGGSSTASNSLGADVTCVNANTFYDGPSVSLTAGTWLATGHVVVKNSGGGAMTAKLWDGTTNYSSSECLFEASGAADFQTLPVGWILTPSSTTTYKISVASTTGSSTGLIKAATVDNASGNTASQLIAVQVA